MTRTASVVLIPHDRLLAPCLDPVAAELAARGFEVLRPTSPAAAAWRHELARAEIVALTPRHNFARADLAACPRLRGIVFATIGVEALDLDAADEMGIAVGFGLTNEMITGMAEANVVMIAAALLDLPRKQASLRLNGWRDGTLRARQIAGKTIGFVGFGRIARATLRRLAGWDVAAMYYDPHVAPPTGFEIARAADLGMLLRASDAVVIMADLRAETRGMIGEPQLAMMKRDAVLVNAARGAVIDEDALARALEQGVVAGAALDAFAVEPLPQSSRLRALDNVLLTPHNLGHTLEQQAAAIPAMVSNIVAIARGEAPPAFKNPHVLEAWRARLARLTAAQ
jgi:D-3-phosphoglycerate dehydrogenase